MMSDREKLIEILRNNATCDMLGIASCAECPYWDKLACYSHALADHLLANGVTFATDNSVGDKLAPTESLTNGQ